MHRKFSPFSGGSFCPDCGKEIEITWLLLRCSCCNSKRKAGVAFNSVVPQDKFCVKCGFSECYIEKKLSPEFFDIQYAVISKKETDGSMKSSEVLQIWIEKGDVSEKARRTVSLLPILTRR